MTTTKKLILKSSIILGLAALVPQISSAQAPTGSLTNSVTGSTNALYDFSLIDELSIIEMDIQKDTDEVKVAYTNAVTQDGRGKLLGIGTNLVSLITPGSSDVMTFDGLCMSKGSITSAKGVAHLTFSTKAVGKAFLEGAERTLSAAATYTVKLDSNVGTVTGRATEKAAAAGLGSMSQSGTFSDTKLPAGLGDGSWTLVLNFTGTNATKLSGDAAVILQTGQVYPFTLKGVFAPKTQQSKLNLKGLEAGLGSSLQVTLKTNQLTRIVGRVAGQSVNIK